MDRRTAQAQGLLRIPFHHASGRLTLAAGTSVLRIPLEQARREGSVCGARCTALLQTYERV
eukprot:1195217-Prorocentrum_minimum.AAC.1